jgi:hypothetical protein
MDWIGLAQDKNRALLNSVLKVRVRLVIRCFHLMARSVGISCLYFRNAAIHVLQYNQSMLAMGSLSRVSMCR